MDIESNFVLLWGALASIFKTFYRYRVKIKCFLVHVDGVQEND